MATAFMLDEFSNSDSLTRARVVAKGLPAKAIRDLIADNVVSMADVARVVAPRRTLDRRLRTDSPLSPEEGDRLAAFARVLGEAARLFGSRTEAMRWLSEPKQAFEGERPLDLLRTGAGTQVIEDFFLRARHGMLA